MNSEQRVSSSNALRDMISELDVDAVGIARLADWKGTKLEETALRLLPEARSVVVFAMEIIPEILDHTSFERKTGAASMNDLFTQDANYLYSRLTEVAYDTAKAAHKMGFKALPLPATGCPQDGRFLEAVFSYKHAAQAAGLGKIGWHSLLITPGFGPRARLSCCLIEAELGPMPVAEIAFECDKCRLCLRNCPSDALARPRNGKQYAINKYACTTFLSASGGCVECMRLCPVGR